MYFKTHAGPTADKEKRQQIKVLRTVRSDNQGYISGKFTLVLFASLSSELYVDVKNTFRKT